MEHKLKDGVIYATHTTFVCSSPRCCGTTALLTGFDLGGYRLRPLDEADIAEWESYDLGPLHCECGKEVAKPA